MLTKSSDLYDHLQDVGLFFCENHCNFSNYNKYVNFDRKIMLQNCIVRITAGKHGNSILELQF